MKKDEHGKVDMGLSFTDDDLHYLTYVNNILHSLFSNSEVYLKNQQMYNLNGLYGHKALIANEFYASTSNNEGIFSCHGYEFEKECEKLLLPNTKVRLKLIRARPNFYMTFYNPHVSVKVFDCSLITRNVVVNEVYHRTIKYQLTHQPACYKFMEKIALTFFIPSGLNQFYQENVFNNAPFRRVLLRWTPIRHSQDTFKKILSIIRNLFCENCSRR